MIKHKRCWREVRCGFEPLGTLRIAFLLTVFGSWYSAHSNASAPNIVLILVDDQSWNGTSVMMDPNVPGSKSIYYQTPRLEQMASQGMRFANGYSAAPLCSPTRAALLTGKSPARLQMTDLPAATPGSGRWTGHYDTLPLVPPVPEPLSANEYTLPQIIKDANPNYVTAHLGKWHLSDQTGLFPDAMGYDHYDSLGPLPKPEVDPKGVFKMANTANLFMEQTVASGQPFYLQLSHYAVHDPVQSRQEIRDKYSSLPSSRVPYAAMTEDLDTSVGMVLDKIQELGIADDTYVIFTSDNGAPGQLSSSAPLAKHKATLREGGIRVPLIVSGPGIEGGSVSHVPVTTVDLFATVADLAGHSGPLPEQVEGASLASIFHNGGQLPPGETHLSRNLTEGGELYWHFPHNFGPGKYSRTKPASAMRDGDYKLYVDYGEHGAPDALYLYNLVTDISETTNLAASMPEKTAEMHAKLENYLATVDASYAYDVKVPATMNWDAAQIGNVPNGWRSTIDLRYKGRETWKLGGGEQAPVVVQTDAYQPGIADQAFRFDGDDIMRRHFFQVGDDGPRRITRPTAGVGDFDRSMSMEFWVKLDSMDQNQVLFETGQAEKGLSLTLGDSDSDGIKNDLRFRFVGLTGADTGEPGVTKEMVVDAKLDRFANPVAEFVHVTAVFNDDPADRYAEVYVNGALAGRVNGLLGTTESLTWDGYDAAGLGNSSGSGFGAAGGIGPLPFTGGGLQGDLALVRFNNFSMDGAAVLERYNSFLTPTSFGVAGFSGDIEVPASRPGSVSQDVSESALMSLVHERNDLLDEDLVVDVAVTGETTLTSGSTPMSGILASGTAFSSYLMHFDPVSSGSSLESVLGSVTFRGEILAVIWDSASLAATDAELGSIGDYGNEANRGVDFTTVGTMAVSADQHTLSFDLDVLDTQMLQFRVLTSVVNGPDFNGDGFVDSADLEIWQASFGLNGAGDADGDSDTDGRDFLIWQREQQPSGMPTLGDVTLAAWQQSYGINAGGDVDSDGDTDGRDFLILQRQHSAAIEGLAAVPEPSSALLAGLLAVGTLLRRRGL